MRTREKAYLLARSVAVATVAVAVGATGVGATGVAHGSHAHHRLSASHTLTLLESGSTLLYPLFNMWGPAFTKTHKSVRITTAATGSGTGISQAEQGSIQIGASDAYLPPVHPAQMMNIPLAISAQMVNYNLPGLNGVHLRLSGAVLAGIYTGKIHAWNDPAIRALNPHVRLPQHAIIPIRRAESSGDTFLFTQYLAKSAGPTAWPASFGTSVAWPALSIEVAETGNSGMVTGLKQNPYSVAYVGISYLNEVAAGHLGEAALRNAAGRFVLPAPATIGASAQSFARTTPKNEALSLILAPGKQSYPIVNYEYAIVSQHQTSSAVAVGVKSFLTWALTTGSSAKFLNSVHFEPLPSGVANLSRAQIAQVR